MLASRLPSEAGVGPSGPQGIASIFEQFDLPGRTAERQSSPPAEKDKFSLSNLNKEAPSLGAAQMQSATIGWTQMLQMLGNTSSSIPPITLGQQGSQSMPAANPAAAAQLPEPSPLFAGGQPAQAAQPSQAAQLPEQMLPAASPFVAAARSQGGRLLEDDPDVLGEGPALAVRTTQRRAKLKAQARVRDDADADWEMEEEDAEPEWKEPSSRNTKEPKVNVRFFSPPRPVRSVQRGCPSLACQ